MISIKLHYAAQCMQQQLVYLCLAKVNYKKLLRSLKREMTVRYGNEW
ncbi:Uncharacterised protein [Klebsiella pneumoniae]|nr:Uncharacterised protein [Klebsiella pneumoniae]